MCVWPCAIGMDSLSNVNIIALNALQPHFCPKTHSLYFSIYHLMPFLPFFRAIFIRSLALSLSLCPICLNPPTRNLCVCILFPFFIEFSLKFCSFFSSFFLFYFSFYSIFFVYLFITDSNAGQREDKTCGDINRETKSRWYRNKGSKKGKWKQKKQKKTENINYIRTT